MAKKKKLKLRIDRVILVAIIAIIILFGLYKGIMFAVDQVSGFFAKEKPVQVEQKEKEYIATVVIDPGHGGYDAGANTKNLFEKDITLTTAKAVGKYLENQNIKVIYTRTEDIELHDDKKTDLEMRAAISKTNQAKYFVSIHVIDFDKTTDVSGFEVYTKNDESTALATSVGTYIEKLNYSKNRGIQDGKSLVVLKANTVPSILVELGYIKGKDYNYLSDNQKLEQIGEAIAKGIVDQVHKK